MVARILDTCLQERLARERQASRASLFDEVWDEVYVIPPARDDQHQQIVGFLACILWDLFQTTRLGHGRPGVVLTDRPENWRHNYRVPDVVVYYQAGKGVRCRDYWTGVPDFVAEVLSPGEEPAAKFGFYARLGTRELLLIHRHPWQLQLFESQHRRMDLVQSSDIEGRAIDSRVLGLKFKLQDDVNAISLFVQHPDGRSWTLPVEKDDDA